MNRRQLAIALLIPFSVLSAYAVYKVGYIGILDYHRHSPAGWQVICDLVIACILLLAWLIPEARRRNITVWPYVVATLFLGSIGPLAYLAINGGRSGD